MLMLPSSVKVYLASQPTDMRKSIDGLLGVVRSTVDADPFGGHLFVFVGRSRDRVKVLFFDHGGFVVYYNHHESYCTSFGSSDRLSRSWPLSRFLAARSTRVSQRLQCFAGGSLGTS